MTRALKVYGVVADGRNRVIVAAQSMAEAARLTGLSIGCWRTYGSETWNPQEVAEAMGQPRVPLTRRSSDFTAPFQAFKHPRAAHA